MSLKGKIALVTGASRGIGRSAAEALAADGARIWVHYHRDRKAAEATLAALPGGPHDLIQADLADGEALARMAGAVTGGGKRVDVLVNNAGLFEEHPLLALDFDGWRSAWERTLALNLMGPALLSHLIGRAMAAGGGGRIINVSSRGAFRGEPNAPAYGASKAGLTALGQSLAVHLAPHKVFVFTIAPGWVATDMAEPTLSSPAGEAVRAQSPLERVASPEEIAEAIRWLAADAPEYMTGCILDANGASYLRT